MRSVAATAARRVVIGGGFAGHQAARTLSRVGQSVTEADDPDVVACGDAAAVPDLTRPGHITAMTAQHAVRQGKLAGHNVAASLGHGRRRRHRHHDLGVLVQLGLIRAAAVPLDSDTSGDVPARSTA